MRVVVQRASSASVTIAGQIKAQIQIGLVIFVGIEGTDTVADGEWLARKIGALRIFADENGQMNKSVVEQAGEILLISQFTLHASTQKGARPSYNQAARPEQAKPLYEQFILQLSAAIGRPVATGEFGADMKVALINDGPVTLLIDSKRRE